MLEFSSNISWSRFCRMIYSQSIPERFYRFTPESLADLPDVDPDIADHKMVKRWIEEINEVISNGLHVDYIYVYRFTTGTPFVCLENITNTGTVKTRRRIVYKGKLVYMDMFQERDKSRRVNFPDFSRSQTNKLSNAYEFLIEGVK